MARILVIDDDVSLLQMMNLMLKRAGHIPTLAQSGHEGIAIARSEHPDMIIVDVMMPDLSGYDVCRTLREDPQTMDIPLLILTALTSDYRDIAVDSGADGFVSKPVTRDDLVKHIDQLLQTGARNMPAPRVPAPEPRPSADAAPKSSTSASTDLPVIAVMGLSGGVGATTLAVNLGLGLMQHGRSCIVDMNNLASQVAAQLKMIPPRASWVDLAKVEPGADKRLIGGALTVNQDIGVAILAAPLTPTQERLSSETINYLYKVLSEAFRRIVVDLPASLNAMSVTTLRLAKHIVLVVGDDPARLLTAPNALAALQELKLSGQQHLVLNRSRPQGGSHEQVIQALQRPLDADLPYEPEQITALAEGRPLVMSRPESIFSQGILRLARQL